MRKAGLVLALLCVVFGATAASGVAAPSLGKPQAVSLSRTVIKAEFEGRLRGRPACRRLARSRFKCRARWTDGLRRYRGRIVLRREDPEVSPVDTYRLRAVGKRRHLRARLYRRTGRIVVDTRYAQLGQMLRLLGINESTDAEFTPGDYMDPYPAGEFDEPAPGTRYVAVEMRIRNRAKRRFNDHLGNGAKLVTTDNRTIDSTYASGCDGSVDMAQEEERIGCVAFEVPYEKTIQQFEYTPDSGFGKETGVWR